MKRSGGIQPPNNGNSAKSDYEQDRTRQLEQSYIVPLEEIERHAILVAVKQLGVTGAAHALGIGKTTIYRKLRSYETNSPEPESGWLAVPLTKLNALLATAAKATEFLKWCQGTIAPRLGQQLGAAVEDFRNWQCSQRNQDSK
jgi:Bacterial regulatory protein, Fis family